MPDVSPFLPTVRLVPPAELLEFLDATATEQDDVDLRRALEMQRHSQGGKDWGFLVEVAGRVVGGLGLQPSASSGTTATVFALTLPQQDESVVIGTALFRHALVHVGTQGMQRFNHLIPARAAHGAALQAIFSELRLPLVRETVQYTWPGGNPPTAPHRLSFRDFAEVGEAAFQRAIERSLEGTLDRVDRRQVEQVGAHARALELYAILRGIEAPEAWWQLAYDAQGGLVGLIVVNRLGADLGTVGYLAVMPGARGHGYGYALLVHGTRTLLGAGLRRILLDTDVTNRPTQQLNERAGYERQGVARRYSAELKGFASEGVVTG